MRTFLRSRAFSILEIMVYISLSTILLLGLFSLFTYIHKQTVCAEALYAKSIKEYMAFDILRHDLLGASTRASDWSISSSVRPAVSAEALAKPEGFLRTPSMIFKKYKISKNDMQQSSSIEWKTVKKNLYRFEGQYDFIKKKWTKKSKSLVCKDVERAEWKLHKDETGQTIIGITAILEFARELKKEMLFAIRSRSI